MVVQPNKHGAYVTHTNGSKSLTTPAKDPDMVVWCGDTSNGGFLKLGYPLIIKFLAAIFHCKPSINGAVPHMETLKSANGIRSYHPDIDVDVWVSDCPKMVIFHSYFSLPEGTIVWPCVKDMSSHVFTKYPQSAYFYQSTEFDHCSPWNPKNMFTIVGM